MLEFLFYLQVRNFLCYKIDIYNLKKMQFSIIVKLCGFLVLFSLLACQTKELTPYEKAKNPYAHLGVEGYMGAAMTSCLGMAPQGPPIVRKKDGATVIADDHSPEQSGYFECVDREISMTENRIKKDKD
jgi:hypothetical protein